MNTSPERQSPQSSAQPPLTLPHLISTIFGATLKSATATCDCALHAHPHDPLPPRTSAFGEKAVNRRPHRTVSTATALPAPSSRHRQPRQGKTERKVEGAAVTARPGQARPSEGPPACKGRRRSSPVSTETPARAALATQRGPADSRKILGGSGRISATGPGDGGG